MLVSDASFEVYARHQDVSFQAQAEQFVLDSHFRENNRASAMQALALVRVSAAGAFAAARRKMQLSTSPLVW